MDEVKQRVIEERDELSVRLRKLTDFLMSDKVLRLSNEMQAYMFEQQAAMLKYLWSLNGRLDIWDKQ